MQPCALLLRVLRVLGLLGDALLDGTQPCGERTRARRARYIGLSLRLLEGCNLCLLLRQPSGAVTDCFCGRVQPATVGFVHFILLGDLLLEPCEAQLHFGRHGCRRWWRGGGCARGGVAAAFSWLPSGEPASRPAGCGGGAFRARSRERRGGGLLRSRRSPWVFGGNNGFKSWWQNRRAMATMPPKRLAPSAKRRASTPSSDTYSTWLRSRGVWWPKDAIATTSKVVAPASAASPHPS